LGGPGVGLEFQVGCERKEKEKEANKIEKIDENPLK